MTFSEPPAFVALNCLTNFTFLKGASHPHEMVEAAYEQGYSGLAITDECSLAGIVKAHVAAKAVGIPLLVGSEFVLDNQCRLTVLSPDKKAYAELSGLITLSRRRSPKGIYQLKRDDLHFRLRRCLVIFHLNIAFYHWDKTEQAAWLSYFSRRFSNRVWLGLDHQMHATDISCLPYWQQLSERFAIPLVACPKMYMHDRCRKPLQDVLTAIRLNQPVQLLNTQLEANAESYLKTKYELSLLYSPELLGETLSIAEQCTFDLRELKYQYPKALVPKGCQASQHLRALVMAGASRRWPQGIPGVHRETIEKELQLIKEMAYEYFFLTVHDITQYAEKQHILYQGRGSAANSVVCYCLFITHISPEKITALFERFISKERNEPPDIDVDFEHERREEIIQYIYQKYTRERAALAASVVTYRSRSAIRDVGKALGIDNAVIDSLSKSLAWWDRRQALKARIESAGLNSAHVPARQYFSLVQQILGFPRHLSQHVGGFVIAEHSVSDIVPLENASMPDRTVIQWDKDDLESMGLLKVDVLSLGMLTAIRKALSYVAQYDNKIKSLHDIPKEDSHTYDMLCQADTVGVFQIESRAQMSMLPRLKPRCFYDLVIQIAIVRPGPIQGDMVHPYLKRRNHLEPIEYETEAIQGVLKKTLGIPIFQEQAIRLAMVAAGFSGGEADQLRRAMASWGKNGNLLAFEERFIHGMLKQGYSQSYAHRLFEQIKGFGGYGFPESHSASFALLCYASSWLKCHHGAAFYCALLNSQPMGFYTPSQLLQDAQRHNIPILPIDINTSGFDNTLEAVHQEHSVHWGIRLGFCRVKSLRHKTGKYIEVLRNAKPFTSIDDLVQRAAQQLYDLTAKDIENLASADAFKTMSGHRYQARWQAASVKPPLALFSQSLKKQNVWSESQEKMINDNLLTVQPSLYDDMLADLNTTGVSLRPHPMAFLRNKAPFNRCTLQTNLSSLNSGRFVRIAGLVTCRQRPSTAKGTLFLTLEDETGNINVVVWKSTQDLYRNVLLAGKLLVIQGRLEKKERVIHVIAGRVFDYSASIREYATQSRDFK